MTAGLLLPGLGTGPGVGASAPVRGAADPGMSAAVQVSFLVTGLFLVGWMVWAVREYRRTGQAMWLWLGVLMAIGLMSGFARFPR